MNPVTTALRYLAHQALKPVVFILGWLVAKLQKAHDIMARV